MKASRGTPCAAQLILASCVRLAKPRIPEKKLQLGVGVRNRPGDELGLCICIDGGEPGGGDGSCTEGLLICVFVLCLLCSHFGNFARLEVKTIALGLLAAVVCGHAVFGLFLRSSTCGSTGRGSSGRVRRLVSRWPLLWELPLLLISHIVTPRLEVFSLGGADALTVQVAEVGGPGSTVT